MGIKLLWLGLTILLVTQKGVFFIPAADIVASIILVIGCILFLLDK